MIGISACLCGINCKYNGHNNLNPRFLELLKDGKAIVICPEILGGLSTPRLPSEIINSNEGIKVINSQGEDVSDNFYRGAKESLNILKLYGIKNAILKDGSPSCGANLIYDGSFSGIKIKGEGITVKLLRENGINVISETDENIEKFIEGV